MARNSEVPCYKIPNSYKRINTIFLMVRINTNYMREKYLNQTSKKQIIVNVLIRLSELIRRSTVTALSTKDAYAWSIPLGAVLGMGIANLNC